MSHEADPSAIDAGNVLVKMFTWAAAIPMEAGAMRATIPENARVAEQVSGFHRKP